MKTLTTIKAWILICSTTVLSNATGHASFHHDVSHHADSMPQKKYQNTIVPFGVQIPGDVLSTQHVACISADSNIFEIMNKAQEYCNGADMRCTFYHFVNHGYQDIGTVDINKELFDDLLKKFDNWLLTSENIEKYDVPLDGKPKEDSSLDTASINVNGSYSNEEEIENSTNVNEAERLYTNQNVLIEKVDNNTNETDDDIIVNTHHTNNLYETHHRNHHHKWKNGNHMKLVPEYNNEHRYFEVFLPIDKETGKPRTIYVEVDRDTNEFILLDEEIDKKLNGIKPIKIELDELSEIADKAFNNLAKSSNHKEHINNSNDDDRSMTSDINTNSALNEDTTHLDIDIEEYTQNSLNSSVCNPNICNINANQQLIPDNTTGNVKKIVNVSKNLVVPYKYINQAHFYIESQTDNTTDEIPNDHLELLESTNETDIHQTGFYGETPLDTIEFNENDTNINLDLDNIECSLENFDTPCDDNSTENFEFSTEYDNVTFNDDSYLQLEENNDTVIDIDFDDTHEFSSSETIHLNESISQVEKPVQENMLNSTPITSSLTARISDYTSSQLDAIPSENRQGYKYLHSPMPSIPISPYTTVPIFEKDLYKVLETDSHSDSSFPAIAALDLAAGASQNSLLNSDLEHPSITSYNSPLQSDFGHQTTRPIISTIFPSPPVECVVKLNKGSKYSPLNFGFSWLPSYSRIEELRLPYAVNSLPQGSIMSLPELKNKPLTDSICPEATSSDHTIPEEDSRFFQTAPSLSVDIQEPSLTTESYHLEADAPTTPKHILPSKLDLPKFNTDLDRISTTHQLSETPLSVMPYSLKDAVNSLCPIQQTPHYLQPTKPNHDLGYIKYSPFDNNSKETMIPCSPRNNRYPYTKFPYFLNPYLKPQYLEPLLPLLQPAAPLQPASFPTPDSLSLSSDQSNPCLDGDYSNESKPIPLLPFAPNTPFSPLNPLLLGPGFVRNTLPYSNLWNNNPYLPYTILPDQNIRNYPPIVSNYVSPSAGLQQNQILEQLPSKSVPLSIFEQPCTNKNILEITPLSYAPFSPVYTPASQKDLNSPSALERDLQSLSLKYGIPLSKILNSLESEISNVHDSSLLSKPILTNTYDVLDDENRSGNEESLLDLSNLIPLDSSLIGPHLELESSLIQESNDSQSYTVLSETTVPPSLHSSDENPPTKVIHDSSLIGPHLSTLSTNNFLLGDENRNANEVLLSESDISNLSLPLDSSLIGPHLEIGSPPIVLDSNNSQGDIFPSHTEVPITISSQIEPKFNIQNQPTNLVLDSSLIGSHLPLLSAVKPLLSDEIQIINDMIPLETDLTDLTLLDSSLIHTQEGLVNQLNQSETVQLEKTAVILSAAVPSIKVHETTEYLSSNITEEEFLLESDSSRLIPLDSSLVGPGLKLGNSPIIMIDAEDKNIPATSLNSLQNTDSNVEELESIILPSSLLPTLLNKPVTVDLNFNIITQETKLNADLDEPSLDSNVELPITDISLIPFKEKDFKIVEPILELPSLIDDNNVPLLTKDSSTIKHKSKSPEITHVVNSESLLDSSLTGTSIIHKLENPEISTSLDSSIHLDSFLIGPSILQEIDSREISPILDSVNHRESSLAATTIDQNNKPSEILTAFDFPIPLDSSLKGPSLHQETLEVSRAFDSNDLLDSSIIGPHLSTVPFSIDEIQMINEELQPESDLTNLVPLDSSLVGPHVDFESELEQSEISRYQNPESSLISVINPDVCEITELPCDIIEGMSPLEPITLPSICTSDQQELLSKFTNAITKSQLLQSELKPCDKLLSSIAKISSDNSYVIPSCRDLNPLLNTPLSLQDELASKFSPIKMTSPAQELSPVGPIVPCFESNYFPIPKLLTELPTYAQGVPQIPFTPYSSFVEMKPFVDRNWLVPQTLNIQNILQTTPSLRPVVGNAPVSFMSNGLTPLAPEDFQPLLDVASHSKFYPQLSIPNMYTTGDAIAPSLEWTTPSNILPLDKYIPLLPKKNSPVLPSNLESTISNSEYNQIVVDDIMSLLDEQSFHLLKDMSILPFSQSSLQSTTPVFQKGEIVSPSLSDTVPILNSHFIKTRPLLTIPITNALGPIYNPLIRLCNPQDIPYMIQTPIISPCNLQTYTNTPLHSQFSEIIGPAPQLVTLPTEAPKAYLQPLLLKPCLKSLIILPSSSLDTVLQLPTASNELNSAPRQLPSEYFTPISPICTIPPTNAFTNPISPIYASPLSVSYAKPISTPSTSLPLNVPYEDNLLTPLPLPINPYTVSPLTPKFSNSVMPLKITQLTDYPYMPAVAQNRPQSEIPYKPSLTYSSPCVPIHASPIPIDTSPGSPNIMNKLPTAMISPLSPVFNEPLSTPYFSLLPKSSTNLGLPAYSVQLAPLSLGTLARTPSGILSPSYLSPDIPTYGLSPLPAPFNTQTQPSNLLTPAYITPIPPESSNLPQNNRPLLSSSMLDFNPQFATLEQIPTTNTRLPILPMSDTVNPFLNTYQRLLINSKTLPVQGYSHVPKSSPLSSSQIDQNIPYEDALESNLLTSPLTEEIDSYDVKEENTYPYSNDKDEKYYEVPSLNYPLESLSYTLAPEEIGETLPPEDLIKLVDITPSAAVNNRASEPSLQTKLYRHYHVTPYTPPQGKPLLKLLPAPQILPPQSFTESIPENIFDNIRLVHSSSPLKHPVSLPTSISSSPLLELITPLTFAPNFPISSPLLHSPCIDTYTSLSPCNKLPMNENLQSLSSSPYYSALSQDMSSPPIDPRELMNIITSQVTPAFSQISTNEAFLPVSLPIISLKSQSPVSPHILDNHIQLSSRHYEPESKTLTSQGSLGKPLPIPSYNQFAAPIITHIPLLEMPITPQYITPLTPAQNLKIKPLFFPQLISSSSPTQTTLQDGLLLNEAPIQYQPYIPQPTALTSSGINIFINPPVDLPYSMTPSVNMVEPISTDLNKPQSSYFTPQYSLQSSYLPVSKSSPIISHSNVPYSRNSSHISMQALTNHIMPSSLFMSSDTDFQTPTNKLFPTHNSQKYSSPSLSLIEPFETAPFFTTIRPLDTTLNPPRPLDTTPNPPNILNPKSSLSNVQYIDPLSPSHHLTQLLQPADSYQTQPPTNVQYTVKTHPKLSPVSAHYASPSSAPTYISLPLETVPKQLINKPSAPQYSIPSVAVYDAPRHSSPSGNPFLNPEFKPTTEYPIPKNLISSPILTPPESIILSNLRPLDISQEPQNLYSSPITSSIPLSSSSLLKPLAKRLPQKSSQNQPQIIPSNSQYVSQLPIDSFSQLIPSTSPLLKSPFLKPLFTTSQNNGPSLPMHFSKSNTAFPEGFSIETVPSVTSPDIALSNYLPTDSGNNKYSGPYGSLVSEIPKIVTPINPSSTTSYSFLKSPFNKHFKSPASTLTNMPLYSNFDILETSPKLPIRANIVNPAEPVAVSAISEESSPLSLDSLDAETIEKTELYELMPDLKDRFPLLPLGYKQHKPFHPAFTSNYLATLQPSKTWLSSTYTTSRPKPPSSIPSLIPEEAELIDTTDFIPLSQIKSEPLIANYSPTDRIAAKPNVPSNIPEPDTLQLSPYTTLLNTEFPSPKYKQLPPTSLTSHYNNKIPQPSPIYLSPQEYKDLTQGLSPFQASSSSPTVLSSSNIDPQLKTNQWTGEPGPQIPFYTSPMSMTPDNWLQSPTFSKSLTFYKKPAEVISEKENIQTLLNKYRPAIKITQQAVNNYPYEPEYSIISEVPSELNSVTPLIKSKQHYTEYIEHLEPNEENDYDPESDNVSADENQPNNSEAKITKNLPEIIKGLSTPNYNNKGQRPQRLSKLDHFYANNHIGKSPHVFTVPNYTTLPVSSSADVKGPDSSVSPEILKDSTVIPTKHFGSIPKLDTYSHRPNEYYSEITDSPDNVPITNSYPQNYLNPFLKYSSQMNSPANTIELGDTSEMTTSSYSPYNNIDEIRYSGYKTYQIPSSKSPQTAYNLGTPTQRYSPSEVTYSSPSPSEVQQNPSSSQFYRPTEISEALHPQYQTPIKMTTPLQTKLGLDSFQETPELNEYYPIEDISKSVDSINEENELKTHLINYINKREDVKNNLFNNNAELTIPIGNIAITRKEPYSANTIETNNPSIGLKVWKSNVKIAEAELKLKFKDLSVNNFMPIVNNLDRYDMEGIRKIVKRYIDEKYGNHIEVNEPYTIYNKYTVIKDFDHNAVDNKYNLLWPTNYV